jgi:hypothetical protein
LREGLYKVDFYTVHGTGCGVIHAIGGKLRGGNSAFAFIGNYQNMGDSITAKVSTQRYNSDSDFKALFPLDGITLTLRGKETGDIVDFEGTALQAPGVTFNAVLSRLSD